MKRIATKNTPDTTNLKSSNLQHSIKINYQSYREKGILNIVDEKYQLNNDTLIGEVNGFENLCCFCTDYSMDNLRF